MQSWRLLAGDPRVRWLLLSALGILLFEGASYFFPAFPPLAWRYALLAGAAVLARKVLHKGLSAILRLRFSSISLLSQIEPGSICARVGWNMNCSSIPGSSGGVTVTRPSCFDSAAISRRGTKATRSVRAATCSASR